MLLKQTPAAPGYNAIVAAGRLAKKNKQNQKSRGKEPPISMCLGKMIMAGIQPFSQHALGACIPDGNCVASVRGFVRKQLTVVVGTAGVGFCHFFMPLASNNAAFALTDAAFGGTTTQWLSATNLGVVGTYTEGIPTNVTSSQLLGGWGANDDRALFSARIVAAGYTIRYTGKEIDRAGQVYAYTHPTHNSSASAYIVGGSTDTPFTANNLATFPETMIFETSREETTIPLYPVNDSELEYSGEGSNTANEVLYPWSQGGVKQPGNFTLADNSTYNVGQPIHTVMMVGTPGSSFIITFGMHYETIGNGVLGYSKTMAQSDPVGVRDLISASSLFQLNRIREAGRPAFPEFKAALATVKKDRSMAFSL